MAHRRTRTCSHDGDARCAYLSYRKCNLRERARDTALRVVCACAVSVWVCVCNVYRYTRRGSHTRAAISRIIARVAHLAPKIHIQGIARARPAADESGAARIECVVEFWPAKLII